MDCAKLLSQDHRVKVMKNMKVTGKKTKCKAMAVTFMHLVQNILANGSMVCSKAKVGR